MGLEARTYGTRVNEWYDMRKGRSLVSFGYFAPINLLF